MPLNTSPGRSNSTGKNWGYGRALREAGGDEVARLYKWSIGPYSNGLFTQCCFEIVTRISLILVRRPECVKVCLFSLPDDALLEPAVLKIRAILSRLTGTVGGMITPVGLKAQVRQYQIFPWTGICILCMEPDAWWPLLRKNQITTDTASRMMFLTPQRATQLANLANCVARQIWQGPARHDSNTDQIIGIGGWPTQ